MKKKKLSQTVVKELDKAARQIMKTMKPRTCCEESEVLAEIFQTVLLGSMINLNPEYVEKYALEVFKGFKRQGTKAKRKAIKH